MYVVEEPIKRAYDIRKCRCKPTHNEQLKLYVKKVPKNRNFIATCKSHKSNVFYYPQCIYKDTLFSNTYWSCLDIMIEILLKDDGVVASTPATIKRYRLL